MLTKAVNHSTFIRRLSPVKTPSLRASELSSEAAQVPRQLTASERPENEFQCPLVGAAAGGAGAAAATYDPKGKESKAKGKAKGKARISNRDEDVTRIS